MIVDMIFSESMMLFVFLSLIDCHQHNEMSCMFYRKDQRYITFGNNIMNSLITVFQSTNDYYFDDNDDD